MPVGPLKRHPTSGALLLTPARLLQRCDVCCGECIYAIRAEPCNQILDKDCEPTLEPIWLCTTSKCFEDPNDVGSYKTGVVIKWAGICYETIPESITLVSKLAPEIVENLINSTNLNCIEGGCENTTECGEPGDVCGCLCRSLDGEGKTDCCMSRWNGGLDPAPWTFDYSYVVEAYVERSSHGSGVGGAFGCLSDDCDEGRACVYFRTEAEIDQAELEASYTPLAEQPCAKAAPIRERVTIRRIGTNPSPPPLVFACCAEPNTAANTWVPAGEVLVNPPNTVPLTEDVDDSGIIDQRGPCYSRTRNTTRLESNCSRYKYEQIIEVWSYGPGPTDDDCCQQYERETRTTIINYYPATDELTRRLCAQCRRSEA